MEAAQPEAGVSRNRRGDPVQLGTTGKYYCGKHLLDCRCCDGNCGPTNGCNCADCMQLDVSSRHLPPGQLVNREGRVSRRSSNGHFYCGRTNYEFRRHSQFGNSTQCGSEGPDAVQCSSCKALEGPRYAAVRSDDAIAGAGSPEDADMESSGASNSGPHLGSRRQFPPPPIYPAFTHQASQPFGGFHPPPPPAPNTFASMPPPHFHGMAPRSRYRGPPPPQFAPRGASARPRFPRGDDGSENGSGQVQCRSS